MTREDIIRMAREAGFQGEISLGQFVRLARFAALVAAHEREACAEMVDHILKEGGGTWGKAIRKRGEVKP